MVTMVQELTIDFGRTSLSAVNHEIASCYSFVKPRPYLLSLVTRIMKMHRGSGRVDLPIKTCGSCQYLAKRRRTSKSISDDGDVSSPASVPLHVKMDAGPTRQGVMKGMLNAKYCGDQICTA
jgi:hypothetical protein